MTKDEALIYDKQMEYAATKFRSLVTWIIVSEFYKNGVLRICDEFKRQLISCFISTEREQGVFIPNDFIELKAGRIYFEVIGEYFCTKHIASYEYFIPYTFDTVTVYAQTEHLMKKTMEKEVIMPYTRLDDAIKTYEHRGYRIDRTQFNKKAGDKFFDLKEGEYEIINKVYPTLARIMVGYNNIIDGKINKITLVDKNSIKIQCVKAEEKNGHPEAKSIIEKYYDKLFDIAAKEIADTWQAYLKSKKKTIYKNNIDLSKIVQSVTDDTLQSENNISNGDEDIDDDGDEIEEEDYYDEDIEEHGITLDAYAFYDEWYDVHKVAPTYDDVLEYCEKPNMIEGIYDGIKRYDTSYKNEEDFAKLLWAAVQKLLS